MEAIRDWGLAYLRAVIARTMKPLWPRLLFRLDAGVAAPHLRMKFDSDPGVAMDEVNARLVVRAWRQAGLLADQQ